MTGAAGRWGQGKFTAEAQSAGTTVASPVRNRSSSLRSARAPRSLGAGLLSCADVVLLLGGLRGLARDCLCPSSALAPSVNVGPTSGANGGQRVCETGRGIDCESSVQPPADKDSPTCTRTFLTVFAQSVGVISSQAIIHRKKVDT